MINQSVDYTIHDFRMKTKTYEQYNMGTNHFHNSYEIYYLISGTRDYFINDKTFRVNAGDMVLINPYVLHKTVDTGQGHTRLLVSFKPSFLPFKNIDNLLKSLFKDNNILTFDTNTRSNVETTFIHMINNIASKGDFFEASLQADLLKLILDLNEYVTKQSNEETTAPAINDKIFEVVQYLNSNYTEKITLTQLSERFFISRYYLSHTFKKVTGFTILNFIQNLRIMKAQQLLCDTDLKIIEIADLVGFTNVSSFGKTFKAITGYSPKSYRSK